MCKAKVISSINLRKFNSLLFLELVPFGEFGGYGLMVRFYFLSLPLSLITIQALSYMIHSENEMIEKLQISNRRTVVIAR